MVDTNPDQSSLLSAIPFFYQDQHGTETGLASFSNAFVLRLRGMECIDDGYFNFSPQFHPLLTSCPVALPFEVSTGYLRNYKLKLELPICVESPESLKNAVLELFTDGTGENAITALLRLGTKSYQTTRKFDLEAHLIGLQNMLPSGLHLRCCLSCFFGTFSPFGGGGNGIFCMLAAGADWLLCKNKSDCIDCMDKHRTRIRLRPITFICDSFRPLGNDTWNYSDWQWCILEKHCQSRLTAGSSPAKDGRCSGE